MTVSAISANDLTTRRNLFIKYANHFMSFKANENENNSVLKKVNNDKQNDKTMGIETLTIFPKQVVDGKIIITA